MSDKATPRQKSGDDKPVSAAGRQDGRYTPTFTAEPKGGPIPEYRPIEEPVAAERPTES